MTPEELIAEQDATITELRAALTAAEADLEQAERSVTEQYWERIYDDIRAAWDAWASAELGTASPSHSDLAGRPELAQLWESVK